MHLRHFESHFSRLLVALCRHKVWTIGHCLKKLEPTNSAIGPLLREGIGQVIARGNPTQIAVDAVDVVAQLKSLRAARIFESPSHGLSLTSMASWPPSEPAQRIPATNACSSAAATRSARRSDRARPTTMKFTPERCWSSSPQLPRCFRLRIFAADCFSFQYQTSPSKQIHEDNLARVDIRSSSYSQKFASWITLQTIGVGLVVQGVARKSNSMYKSTQQGSKAAMLSGKVPRFWKAPRFHSAGFQGCKVEDFESSKVPEF